MSDFILTLRLAPQFLDLAPQGLVFTQLDPQKTGRELGLGGDPRGRQQVGVGELVLAVAEVLHLDQPLVQQGADAVVGLAQAHAQGLGQLALAEAGIGFQQAQDLEVVFVVEGAIGRHGADESSEHATAVL